MSDLSIAEALRREVVIGVEGVWLRRSDYEAALGRVTTAREHAQRIMAEHFCSDQGNRWACWCCNQEHPCSSFTAAEALLVLLGDPNKEQA